MDLSTLRSNPEAVNEIEEAMLAPAGQYLTIPEWSVREVGDDGEASLRFSGYAKLVQGANGAAPDEKPRRLAFTVNFSSTDIGRQGVKIRPQVYRAFKSAFGAAPETVEQERDYILKQPVLLRVIQLEGRTSEDGREFPPSNYVVGISAPRE